MRICLWHGGCLAAACHGPHCPSCGAPDFYLTRCIDFHRRDRTATAVP